VALIEPARLEDLALGLEGVLAARGIPRSTPLAFRAEAEPNAVTLALALFRIGRTLVSTDEVHELVDRAQHAAPVVLPESRPDDLAAIVFTSGTSAEPKAVLLERRAFEASARASATNLGWRDDDRWLLGLPFAHVGGLSILTRVSLARKKIVRAIRRPS
jgi:acyl-CoA synthetase (AMP-forming)/AMP-acid ligase II